MMKHFNPLVVIVVLIGLSVTVSSLFLYSYFGTYTTEIFLKYSDYLFESPWNDLPIKLQKHVLIMISNSQRSHCYRGNGLFILDLKFFTKVMMNMIVSRRGESNFQCKLAKYFWNFYRRLWTVHFQHTSCSQLSHLDKCPSINILRRNSIISNDITS